MRAAGYVGLRTPPHARRRPTPPFGAVIHPSSASYADSTGTLVAAVIPTWTCHGISGGKSMPTAALGAQEARFEVDGQRGRRRSPSRAQRGGIGARCGSDRRPAASRAVSRLVDTSARLTGADPLGVGLLAFADPLLLSAPLDIAIQAHVDAARRSRAPRRRRDLDHRAGVRTGARRARRRASVPARGRAGWPAPSAARRGESRSWSSARSGSRAPSITWVPGRGDPTARTRAWRSARRRTSASRSSAHRCSTGASRSRPRSHAPPSAGSAASRSTSTTGRSRISRCCAESSHRCARRSAHGEDLAPRRDPLSQLDDLQAIAEATEADLRELAGVDRCHEPAAPPVRRRAARRRRSVRAAQRHRARRSRSRAPETADGGRARDAAAGRRRGAGERARACRRRPRRDHRPRRRGPAVEAEISDDGCGFDLEHTLPAAARRGSMGLLGMVERVRHLGGTCDVEGRKGRARRSASRSRAKVPSGAAAAPPRLRARAARRAVRAARSRPAPAVPVRVPDRLGAVRHAELAVDVAEVKLHRLLGDEVLLADRACSRSLGERTQDLEFAFGEPDGADEMIVRGLASAEREERGAAERRAQGAGSSSGSMLLSR